MQVQDLITKLYSKSWVRRMLAKAETLIDLATEVTSEVLFFLGNFFTKVNKLIKDANYDLHQQNQDSSQSNYQQLQIQFTNAGTNSISDQGNVHHGDRSQVSETNGGSLCITRSENGRETMDNRHADSTEHDCSGKSSEEQDSSLDSQFKRRIQSHASKVEARIQQFADGATKRVEESTKRVEESTKRVEESTKRVEESTERVEESTERVNYVCSLGIGLIETIERGLGIDVESINGSSKDSIPQIEQQTIDVKVVDIP